MIYCVVVKINPPKLKIIYISILYNNVYDINIYILFLRKNNYESKEEMLIMVTLENARFSSDDKYSLIHFNNLELGKKGDKKLKIKVYLDGEEVFTEKFEVEVIKYRPKIGEKRKTTSYLKASELAAMGVASLTTVALLAEVSGVLGVIFADRFYRTTSCSVAVEGIRQYIDKNYGYLRFKVEETFLETKALDNGEWVNYNGWVVTDMKVSYRRRK